ncbi:MAG: hypothetical protein JW750_07460 [Anaerolineaceae bacterium]|nr:hypothetical protein [Anaerolineaceae bacterium]
MNSMTTKLIGTAVLFVLTLGSGVVLSHSGRPYGNLLFNLHKLISVGAMVLVAVTAVKLYKTGSVSGFLPLVVMILNALFFLGLIATGGILSIKTELPVIALKIHQIFPLLCVLVSALNLYILSRWQS